MQKDSTVDAVFQYPDALEEFDDIDLNSSASQLDRDVKEENTASSNKTESNKFFQQTEKTENQKNSTENDLKDKTESNVGEKCTCDKKFCCIL